MKSISIILFLFYGLTPQNLNRIYAQQPEYCLGQVFLYVENSATFRDGDLDYFRSWVQQTIEYPEEDLKNRISGSVVVQFVVNTYGHIINIKILKGATPTMDAKVIKVLLSSPEWEPARQGAGYVCQQFTMLVNFQLPE